MLPILQIGPIALPLPALIILLGIWLGLSAAERAAARSKINPDQLSNLILLSLLSGVIAARLSFVVRYPQAFAGHPLNIFARDFGLFDLWGGLAAGLIVAFSYGQRKRMPFWATLDSLAPGLAVLAVAFGLSHLASGSAFGVPSSIPWAIELWGARRQPVQVYEILLAALILWSVWPGKGWIHTKTSGVRFLGFIALSAAARLILETWRGDSMLIFGGIRLAQIAAWCILAASLWGIGGLNKQPKPNDSRPEREPTFSI